MDIHTSLVPYHEGTYTLIIYGMQATWLVMLRGHKSPFLTSMNDQISFLNWVMCRMPVYLCAAQFVVKLTDVLMQLVLWLSKIMDPLLKWPFDSILVDQNHQKHVVQTFQKVAHFKDLKCMNAASGCPQSCSQTDGLVWFWDQDQLQNQRSHITVVAQPAGVWFLACLSS